MTLLLREQDVAQLLTMSQALDVVEAAFRDQAGGLATNRPRQRVHLAQTQLHVMAAGSLRVRVSAVKAYTSSRRGARFLVLLYDGDSGELLALIEADRLGQLRTGAASGVATKYLARADACTVGVIGAGWQAESQLDAVCAVRTIRAVRVYSRRPEARTAFAGRMSGRLNVPVEAVSTAEAAVREQDIVITATSAHDPVLLADWLADGAHVNAIGANALGRRELDRTSLQRAAVVAVDSLEQARLEAGDLVDAIERGARVWEGIQELGRIVAGQVPGRRRADDLTIFRSLGIALEDLAVAEAVYRQAIQSRQGQRLAFGGRRAVSDDV